MAGTPTPEQEVAYLRLADAITAPAWKPRPPRH